MREKNIVPVFDTEAEEAQWWFDHREDFARDFKQSLADDSVRVGTVAKRMGAQGRSITLHPADEAKAKLIATRKGLEYETFVQELVHRELERTPDAEAALSERR